MLIGQTIKKLEQRDSSHIYIITEQGNEYLMHHERECCESVVIDDIEGNLEDLVGSPILQAEEVLPNAKLKIN